MGGAELQPGVQESRLNFRQTRVEKTINIMVDYAQPLEHTMTPYEKMVERICGEAIGKEDNKTIKVHLEASVRDRMPYHLGRMVFAYVNPNPERHTFNYSLSFRLLEPTDGGPTKPVRHYRDEEKDHTIVTYNLRSTRLEAIASEEVLAFIMTAIGHFRDEDREEAEAAF